MVNICLLFLCAKLGKIFHMTKDFNVFNICDTEVLKVLNYLHMS